MSGYNVDGWSAPAMGEFLKSADQVLVPKMQSAGVMILLAPGDGAVDTKFAVELGLAVMLEKPIILMLIEGRDAPRKVKDLADEIVVVPVFTAATADAAVRRALARLEARGVVT